jgi:uncharacterized membrane protein HdeD (DUF308 family)
MATGLIICAQLLLAYGMGGINFDGTGSVVKESVMLGWGVWTAIGGMLAFLMPACFYFAHSHRNGWVYYLLGLLEYLCIFLSQSRGALLFGTLVLGLCVLILLFSGKNKKMNEPAHQLNSSVWIKTIRKANTLNIVIINPGKWISI